MRFRILGSRRWLALADGVDEAGEPAKLKAVFAVQEAAGWKVVSEGQRGDDHEVVGLGPWPGGAVVAALRRRGATTPPWFEVLEGSPAIPLPQLPDQVGAGLDITTTERGEAFAAWNVEAADEGVALLHWPRGEASARTEIVPGVRLTHRMSGWTRFLDAPSGTFVAVETPYGSPRRVTVLRLDGARWQVAGTFADARGPEGMTVTPDGALWIVVHVAHDGWNRSELWRRAPGAKEQWEQVVPRIVGRTTTLVATQIMPAERGDILFVGELDGAGTGIYRLRLPDR